MTGYEISNTIIQGITGIAILATFYVYYKQLSTMQNQLIATQESSKAQNFISIINVLQVENVRNARTTVRDQLRNKQYFEWSEDEKRAASLVCSNYDMVGILLQEKLIPASPIIDNWGSSIIDCFEILEPHIQQLRETNGIGYWNDFQWLKEQVSQRNPSPA